VLIALNPYKEMPYFTAAEVEQYKGAVSSRNTSVLPECAPLTGLALKIKDANREPTAHLRPVRRHVPQSVDRQREPVRHYQWGEWRRQDSIGQIHNGLRFEDIGWRPVDQGPTRQRHHTPIEPAVGSLWQRQDSSQ
jgi:hypothetical protein